MSISFRKKALSKLSSPDELDTLLQITSPKTWVALITMMCCLIVVLLWGVYGQISYKINGSGILMSSKGLFTISAPSGGQLSIVQVEVGKKVNKGEVVAYIIHPNEVAEVDVAKKKLDKLLADYKTLESVEQETLNKKATAFASRKKEINLSIQTNQSKIKRLDQRIKGQQALLDKGLLTKHTVSAIIEDRDNTWVQILTSKNGLEQLNVEIYQAQLQKNDKLKKMNEKIQDAKNDFQLKTLNLKETADIISPLDGVVVELPVQVGDRVSVNQVIMTLEQLTEKKLDLMIVQYYPAISAKKISQSMTMQVAPGTVKVDQFGYALASVYYVAEFPATKVQLMEDFHNETLVKQILSRGTVLEVRASLEKDASTFSGYRWTSSGGPPLKLGAGTECTSSVIVESVSPITLAIPMLKKYLLGIGSN